MDKEYQKIIKKIIKNRKFNKLKTESHHSSNNRFDHSCDVAYKTFLVCKKLNLDYKSATRAALMHDFFFKSEVRGPKEIVFHPKYAYLNASKIMKLNDLEKNIILSHMFPVSINIPKYKESIIVDIIDDLESFKDVKNIVKRNIKTIENIASFILFIIINTVR